MGKSTAVVLHPRDWERYESTLKIVHASIGGKVPRKRDGTATFDGYADVVTEEGKQDLFDKIEEYHPEIFLFWMHVGMNPQIIKRVKEISPRTKIVVWHGNHRYEFPHGVRMYLKYLSMVLINSREPSQYKMYKDGGVPNVATLWDGFNPDDVELEDKEPEFDCIFGGNSYLGRTNNLPGQDFPGGLLRYNLIVEANKRFNVAVLSDVPEGWPFKVLPAAFHPKYTNELRRAKITLNINHFPGFYQAYTRRTIRSIFAKRLHLTLYIPGMEEHFENHENIVWYHDLNEAMELIGYYLENDDEREEIAEKSWMHACKHFTFENRLRDFEKIAKVLL